MKTVTETWLIILQILTHKSSLFSPRAPNSPLPTLMKVLSPGHAY